MSPHHEEQRLLRLEERAQLMGDLCDVVRQTKEHVLTMQEDSIRDTVVDSGHPFSTVDDQAGNMMRWAIERKPDLARYTVLEESMIPRGIVDPEEVQYPVIICDAVEGSTNAKRGLAAHVRRPILAGSSAVILEGPLLATIAASAFCDFASGKVFSSVRGEPGRFLAYVDGAYIPSRRVLETRGDTHVYAVVPGYSHGNVRARAEVEEVLLSAGIRTTGGSRSSAQDLVGLLCNEVDAYVDLRTLFPGSTDRRDEVLHFWDVGGLVSVLDAMGFIITDAHGGAWQQHHFGDRLALVVARPSLSQRILRAIQEVSFLAATAQDRGPVAIAMPPAKLGS